MIDLPIATYYAVCVHLPARVVESTVNVYNELQMKWLAKLCCGSALQSALQSVRPSCESKPKIVVFNRCITYNKSLWSNLYQSWSMYAYSDNAELQTNKLKTSGTFLRLSSGKQHPPIASTYAQHPIANFAVKVDSRGAI